MSDAKPISLSARGMAVARVAAAAMVWAAGGGVAGAQVADAPSATPGVATAPAVTTAAKPVIELPPVAKPSARATPPVAGPGLITLPAPPPPPVPKPMAKPAPRAEPKPKPGPVPAPVRSAPVAAPAAVPAPTPVAVPPKKPVAPSPVAAPAAMPPPDRTDMVLMGLGLLASVGWVVAWVRHRRRPGAETAREEAEAAPAALPQPEPEPEPPLTMPPLSATVAAPAPPAPPPPPPPAPPAPFTPAAVPGQRVASAVASAPLLLEATPERLTISLVMATLRYRLRIANRGETALGEVVVRGGMIAAHASLPEHEQLGGEGAVLDECHHFIGLAPGEAAELSGEFRVPLADLAPIRVGDAALFVPLVRFRASAVAVSGAVLEEACVVAVGEPPATPGAGIRPFRLDLGPRLYHQISSRRLVAPD